MSLLQYSQGCQTPSSFWNLWKSEKEYEFHPLNLKPIHLLDLGCFYWYNIYVLITQPRNYHTFLVISIFFNCTFILLREKEYFEHFHMLEKNKRQYCAKAISKHDKNGKKHEMRSHFKNLVCIHLSCTLLFQERASLLQ